MAKLKYIDCLVKYKFLNVLEVDHLVLQNFALKKTALVIQILRNCCSITALRNKTISTKQRNHSNKIYLHEAYPSNKTK